MASLRARPKGAWQISWDKKRRHVTFDAMTRRQALAARQHMNHLIDAQEMKTPIDRRTREWLDTLSAKVHARIAEHGLCDHRFAKESRTVDGLCKHYLQWKSDAAESSKVVYGNAIRMLTEHFKPGTDIASITPADMDDFIKAVYKSGIAKTTASRRIQTVQSIFRRAARQKWIAREEFYDMFENVPRQTRTNPKRQHWVAVEIVEKAIEHAKNNEQRLLFALGRWGGIRMPSELLEIRWDDIDRESEKILIRSPKQINHEHRRERLIPLWPEIRKYLDIAWDEADAGQIHVIDRYRSSHTSAHSQLFTRACYRAGIVEDPRKRPWPKLWNNMRATRVTELRKKFPTDAVNYWMNHSESISKTHYQQWDSFEWRETAESRSTR